MPHIQKLLDVPPNDDHPNGGARHSNGEVVLLSSSMLNYFISLSSTLFFCGNDRRSDFTMALTLFTTLAQQASSVDIDGDVAGGPSSSSSSSSSSPEIIQLYSNAVLDFLNGTIVKLGNSPTTIANAAVVDVTEQQFEGGGSSRRQFSALSYQAVQTLGRDTDDERQQRQHLRPDLGVWDCCVDDVELATANNAIPLASMLLQRVVIGTTPTETLKKTKTKQTTVLMTIDVSSLNNISMVQSVVEQMRNVILGAFTTIDCNSSEVGCNDMSSKTAATVTTSASSYTTSTKSLQHSTFGKAKINEEVGTTVEGGDNTVDNNNIALILAAIVPSSSSSSSTTTTTTSKGVDEYSERQSRAFLSYHLRKFALELNCTLCFVSSSDIVKSSNNNSNKEEEGTSTMPSSTAMTTLEDPMISGSSNDGSTTMSVDELACLVRRIALGISHHIDDIVEGIHKSSSICFPGTHDSELVYGPYLRNASCEGKWDATVDDLNVAFPPVSTKTTTTTTGMIIDNDKDGIGEGGDEAWLNQLATSIGITTDAGPLSPLHKPLTTPKLGGGGDDGGGNEKTSVPKKRVTRLSSTRNKDTAKTPKDEKEVMNFFDNLLKK